MNTSSSRPSKCLTYRIFNGLFLGVFASLMSTTAYGQTQWTGGTSTSWEDENNWSHGVPVVSPTERVTIRTETGDLQPILESETGPFGSLWIGSVDGSQLTLQNGGQVEAGSVTIGNSTINNDPANHLSDEAATVFVDGPTSSFSAAFFNLGAYGAGTLSLSDGATLNTTSSTNLGTMEGSLGELNLSGDGTTASLANGIIGGDGSGVMNVESGASVTSGAMTIANGTGSVSSANVSGAGSTWDVESGSLVIGGLGEGTLAISDAGAVGTSGRVFVGNSAGSTGSLDIAGAGSLLNSGDYVAVGNRGDGHGSVTDGGVLQASEVLVC